jgi:hypothetical protein
MPLLSVNGLRTFAAMNLFGFFVMAVLATITYFRPTFVMVLTTSICIFLFACGCLTVFFIAIPLLCSLAKIKRAETNYELDYEDWKHLRRSLKDPDCSLGIAWLKCGRWWIKLFDNKALLLVGNSGNANTIDRTSALGSLVKQRAIPFLRGERYILSGWKDVAGRVTSLKLKCSQELAHQWLQWAGTAPQQQTSGSTQKGSPIDAVSPQLEEPQPPSNVSDIQQSSTIDRPSLDLQQPHPPKKLLDVIIPGWALLILAALALMALMILVYFLGKNSELTTAIVGDKTQNSKNSELTTAVVGDKTQNVKWYTANSIPADDVLNRFRTITPGPGFGFVVVETELPGEMLGLRLMTPQEMERLSSFHPKDKVAEGVWRTTEIRAAYFKLHVPGGETYTPEALADMDMTHGRSGFSRASQIRNQFSAPPKSAYAWGVCFALERAKIEKGSLTFQFKDEPPVPLTLGNRRK